MSIFTCEAENIENNDRLLLHLKENFELFIYKIIESDSKV